MSKKRIMRIRLMSLVMSIVIAVTPNLTASAMSIDQQPTSYSVSERVAVNKSESHVDEYIEFKQTIRQESYKYVPPVEESTTMSLSQEDIDLIALVTMAEAEGECELGKRLVIDVVLNRMDHEKKWPDTAKGVIYQRGQFTSMHNGRSDRCYVRDDIVELVKEELISRTNTEVTYFRTGHYHGFGTPIDKVGNHYFSGC